jgi:hypothetical protein
MSSWQDLDREIGLWAAAGRRATLWWRDDDAVADTPALRRLLDVARAPLALAVIPEGAGADLAAVLDRQPGAPGATVFQHGFRHRNNAAPDAKKCEFPDGRAPEVSADELRRGRDRLTALFPRRFLPVFTPPWNRIGSGAIEMLAELGFRGLSTYLPRRAARLSGLAIVNTHVDVIDWQTRRFLGEAPALDLLVGHFQARRLGAADPAEPTGLLTHHLVHDAETWRFLENLQDFLRERPARHREGPAGAGFIEPAEAFGMRPGSPGASGLG